MKGREGKEREGKGRKGKGREEWGTVSERRVRAGRSGGGGGAGSNAAVGGVSRQGKWGEREESTRLSVDSLRCGVVFTQIHAKEE